MKRIGIIGLSIMCLQIAGWSQTVGFVGAKAIFPGEVDVSFGAAPYAVIDVGWRFSGTNGLCVSYDYWFFLGHIVNVLDYYAGAGLYGFLYQQGTNMHSRAAIRVPLGLQIWPARNVELFIELGNGIFIHPTFFYDPMVAAGFRLHFN